MVADDRVRWGGRDTVLNGKWHEARHKHTKHAQNPTLASFMLGL